MKVLSKLIIVITLVALMFAPYFVIATDTSINEVKVEATPISEDEIALTQKITEIEDDTVNVQLKVETNDEKVINSDTEVLFLIDDSTSMLETLEDGATSRKIKVLNSTKELIKKINANNPNVKMGIMFFSTGTNIVQGFTDNKNQLLNACDQSISKAPDGNTNMASALSQAKQKFSSNAKNKIIILLTDGEPTDGADQTKAQLQDSNIYIISTLVGLKNENQQKIASIFGTESNPTADRFYNIADNDIETTISKNIYNRIITDFENPISDITAVDFIQDEITDNFDVMLLNVSNGEANLSEDKITWSVGSLKTSKVATLNYKLALKDDFDPNIIDKVLDTSETVKLTYNNKTGDSELKKTLDSPQIKLNTSNDIVEASENKEVKAEKETNTTTQTNKTTTNKTTQTKNKITTTTPKTSIPYTGSKDVMLVAGIVILTISSIVFKIKSR